MVELSIEDVTKRYDDAQGTETAVSDLSLTVEDELLVLLGPSGCGKTTTLRMVAGLEDVTSGTIRIDGRDVTDVHPSERSIAMVFQDYGLYTTMSVRKNMAYGLKHSTSLSKAERTERVREMAAMFDIEDLLDREVDELSGGQKQRVALGRAMVREPDVFLLDEPLASLDAKLRSEMRTELQRLQHELDITTLYVTHDQKEAMTMADRVAVLHDGDLRQVDPPETVYDDPADRFVADFLGNPSMNQFDAAVRDAAHGLVFAHEGVTVATHHGDDLPLSPGDDAVVGMRPETLRLDDGVGGASGDAPVESRERDERTDGGDAATFTATVDVTEYQGNDNFVHCRLDGTAFTAVVPPSVQPAPGETVQVAVDSADVYVFDPDTGDALTTPGRDRGAVDPSS